MACPGSPFSKIARTTPFPPWAEDILPMIIFGSFPVDFHVAVLPTNFEASSLDFISGISIRKCLGLNVFRPRLNCITFALTIVY